MDLSLSCRFSRARARTALPLHPRVYDLLRRAPRDEVRAMWWETAYGHAPKI